MNVAAYLIKSALRASRAESRKKASSEVLDTAIDRARHQTYQAGLRLSQLEKIRELRHKSQVSPWAAGGVGAGIGGVAGALAGLGLFRKPVAGMIGGGVGAALGGAAGALYPSRAEQKLQAMAEGRPGLFEVLTAPPGLPQAFGDDDRIMVQSRLKQRNRELLKELLRQ